MTSIRLLIIVVAAGALCTATGCADPWLEVQRLNPYIQRQWASDEAYTATLHKKLRTLREIQPQLAELSPPSQQEWARTLEAIIREDDNAMLRAAATAALAELPAPLSTSGLLAAAKDPSAKVRIAACAAWSHRSDSQAVELLAGMLGSDTDLDVQLAAARALGKFKDPRAISALGLALDSKDPALQYRAAESLASLTPVDYGHDVKAWKTYLAGGNPPPPSSSWSDIARIPRQLTNSLPWLPWR